MSIGNKSWLALPVPMDPIAERYSFHQIFVIYRRLAYSVFFSGMGISLLDAMLSRLDPDLRGMSSPAVWMALASITALLFIAWLTACYEQYQHQVYRYGFGATAAYDKWPYPVWKYLITWLLGLGSLLGFIVGFFSTIVTLSSR